jgi:hypothetical protein
VLYLEEVLRHLVGGERDHAEIRLALTPPTQQRWHFNAGYEFSRKQVVADQERSYLRGAEVHVDLFVPIFSCWNRYIGEDVDYLIVLREMDAQFIPLISVG